MYPNLVKVTAVAALLALITACGGSSNGGGDNATTGNGGASQTNGGDSTASLQLSDGDVLGGGSSVVRINASDNVVRVNSNIVRQGALPECDAMFVDSSLAENTLLEACVSNQGACAVSFQPIGSQVEVIPPPLYAPIGVEYQVSLLDQQGAVTTPVTAVFCFDVGVNLPPRTAADTFQLTFPSRIQRTGVRYGERCEKLADSQGVLANDDDDEHVTNSCLQARLVEGPRFASNRQNFASTFGSDGSFVYEAFESAPPEDASGRSFDTFTYVVTDGVNPTGEPVTVELVFTSDNRAPTATDDSFTINEDSGLQVLQVLDNDTDPDALPLTIARVENGPGNGMASIRNGTVIEYRPNAGFVGSDSFRYVIEDSGGITASANVVVTVANVNDAPVARNDNATINENSSVELQVIDNDSDPENNTLTVTSVTQPVNGSATVATPGSVIYTPDANFFGRDSFQYTISDGTDTANATVIVDVVSVNSGPTANTDNITVVQGGSVEFDLLANDSDTDGDSLSIVSVGDPANGTVFLLNAGVVLYTPNATFNGSDSFSYVLTDGAEQVTGQVNVSVSFVNGAPTANDDTVSTEENDPIRINVLVNDSDPDGDELTLDIVSQPENGTVGLGNNRIVYRPENGFSGTDQFSYSVTDTSGISDVANVTVTVIDVNAGPTAVDDSVTTNEDAAVLIAVTDNDTDPDGDALTVSISSVPALGTVLVQGTAILYTPATGFSGAENFTYSVTDPAGSSDTATVNVTVTNLNAAPLAEDDAVSTAGNTAILVDVTDNDSDPDGDSLTVALSSPPSDGTAVLQGSDILYTPDTGFAGTDQFVYSITDSSGASAQATVSVSVSIINTPPVAGDDAIDTELDDPVSIAVLNNDSDPDNDSLTLSVVSQPANGTASLNSQGDRIVYSPATGFVGVDTFDYAIDDGSSTSIATVTVTVVNTNLPPVAVDDTALVVQGQSTDIDIIANDSDPNSDNLTYSILGAPANGSVTLLPDNNINYISLPTFTGLDSLTYQVNDGNGGTDTATVGITVVGINQAPVLSDDVETTSQDQPLVIDVLANDSDPDNDPLQINSVAVPANGLAVIVNNTIEYTPNAGFSGTDTFTYSASDPDGAIDTATVDVTVVAVNQAPLLTDDAETTMQDQQVIIDVLANDIDPEGDPLQIDSVSLPVNGAAVIVSNTIEYTPTAGFSGTDTFTYDASDSTNVPSTATITVTVVATTPPNTAPVANDDSVATPLDTAVIIAVMATDADGDPLTVSITTMAVDGVASVDLNNDIVYTPNPGFTGIDSFVYTVDDGLGGADIATVEVTVGP